MKYRSAMFFIFAVSCCTIGFTSFLAIIWKWKIASLEKERETSVIRSGTAKLDLKGLTVLIAEEMELMKRSAQINVEDKDLSFINICFLCHCYLLKRYSTTCGWSCSNIFSIHDSKKAKIKGSDEISLDVAEHCKKIPIHCSCTKSVFHLLKGTRKPKGQIRWNVTRSRNSTMPESQHSEM